jgi:3'-phosphoadenosine 5'-phosphosulfate sulfotransferase (PAPS reductase)/FAD synthetase
MTLDESIGSPTHVVWLSGGKDSTAMALRLAEMQPDVPFRFVCTPTGDELPEMVAHWARLEALLGRPLEQARHRLTLNELIAEMGALPNWRMRWCTRLLKIEVAQAWYARHTPCVAYVGLRADEPTREGGIFGEQVAQRFPLREWGWGLRDVRRYLAERGVTIPQRTDCARCPFQRLGDWWELWKQHPDLYADAEAQEARTGHTFRSAQRDAWPADLHGLRERFVRGDVPRGVELNGNLFGDDATVCRACTL